MRLKLMGTMLTALSLTVGSVAAAQSAAPLSLGNSPAFDRAGADATDASALRGPGLWIAGVVVLALAIWGVSELLDNETAVPASP